MIVERPSHTHIAGGRSRSARMAHARRNRCRERALTVGPWSHRKSNVTALARRTYDSCHRTKSPGPGRSLRARHVYRLLFALHSEVFVTTARSPSSDHHRTLPAPSTRPLDVSSKRANQARGGHFGTNTRAPVFISTGSSSSSNEKLRAFSAAISPHRTAKALSPSMKHVGIRPVSAANGDGGSWRESSNGSVEGRRVLLRLLHEPRRARRGGARACRLGAGVAARIRHPHRSAGEPDSLGGTHGVRRSSLRHSSRARPAVRPCARRARRDVSTPPGARADSSGRSAARPLLHRAADDREARGPRLRRPDPGARPNDFPEWYLARLESFRP